MSGTSALTPQQWQWVAERWLEGYTLRELGAFVGLHRETIRRGLVRMGLRPEYKSDLKPLRERRQEYERLKEETTDDE